MSVLHSSVYRLFNRTLAISRKFFHRFQVTSVSLNKRPLYFDVSDLKATNPLFQYLGRSHLANVYSAFISRFAMRYTSML